MVLRSVYDVLKEIGRIPAGSLITWGDHQDFWSSAFMTLENIDHVLCAHILIPEMNVKTIPVYVGGASVLSILTAP